MWETLHDSTAGWAEQAVPPQLATSPTLLGSCESTILTQQAWAGPGPDLSIESPEGAGSAGPRAML